MFEGLRKKFMAATVIIVSHRLSTIKNMDLIYFLEAPSKIEIGRHIELLEGNLRYRELFASQIEPARSYNL